MLAGRPLGQLLGEMGRARLANHLNPLAKAANTGCLPVTPDTEIALRDACAEVQAMCKTLLTVLGGRQLAAHLLRADKNEHVDLHEIRGFMAGDLHGPFQEAHAASKVHEPSNPSSRSAPPEERAPIEVFETAIESAEDRLGLTEDLAPLADRRFQGEFPPRDLEPGKHLDLIRKTRVVLESHCWTTYPACFRTGEDWLGEIVRKIRKGGDAHPAKTSTTRSPASTTIQVSITTARI